MTARRLTIIVPVFNERDSLAELTDQILAGAAAAGATLELIFVDDGSNDGSWDAIVKLAQTHGALSGIRFRRNFGKAAALSAGLKAATGDVICLMDADLQDDPAELPRMLAKLDEGWDLVNGWKKRRLDPWHKVYPSKVFNALVGGLTGLSLHDHNCGFKLFVREAATELKLYGELHRFIPVLAHARGFRVTEIDVNHRPRFYGHSKYGFRRFTRGLLDLLTVAFLIGYRQRPQHLLGAAGLLFLLTGAGGLAYLAVAWMLMNIIHVWPAEPIGSRPLLAYSIAATLLGGQALSLGLLAELLVHFTSRQEDGYSVAERVAPANRTSAD